MKVNHGMGVTSVYLNFRDGLTSFLLHGKGKEYEESNFLWLLFYISCYGGIIIVFY